MQTYDRDSKVETPAEKLRVCLWLIGKFENADEVLPAVETALKSLKSRKLYTKKRNLEVGLLAPRKFLTAIRRTTHSNRNPSLGTSQGQFQ
jgi:hypothetical protein